LGAKTEMKLRLLGIFAVAFMQFQPQTARAVVFDFTLVGTYTASGTNSPISGTLTFDDGLFVTAASINLGAFGTYDQLGGFGSDLGSSFRVPILNAAGDSELFLYLDSYTTLATGQLTTIDPLTYIVDVGPAPDYIETTRDAALSGNFTVASVPEPSTWAMMILGFAGLGFMAYRRKAKPVLMAA
jgi:hypothetical protein